MTGDVGPGRPLSPRKEKELDLGEDGLDSNVNGMCASDEDDSPKRHHWPEDFGVSAAGADNLGMATESDGGRCAKIEIGFPQLQALLKDESLLEKLQPLQIRMGQVLATFQKLDCRGVGHIPAELFIDGLLRLREHKEGIDVIAAKTWSRRVHVDGEELKADAQRCKDCFVRLVEALRRVQLTEGGGKLHRQDGGEDSFIEEVQHVQVEANGVTTNVAKDSDGLKTTEMRHRRAKADAARLRKRVGTLRALVDDRWRMLDAIGPAYSSNSNAKVSIDHLLLSPRCGTD